MTTKEQEYQRLYMLFRQVREDQLKLIDPLLHEAADLRVICEKLRNTIESEGVVELFQQGKQNFTRVSPALKSYNTTVKNYAHIIQQLSKYLPEQYRDKEMNDIHEWLK